jgi:uncharacterized delta-60 repeat protein
MFKTSHLLAACTAGLLGTAGAMAAQPLDGTIDTTFGFLGSGRALVAFDESAASPLDIARAAVADGEGRTYLVGTVMTNAGAQIGITRLQLDGSPDPDYGDEGRVVAPAGAIVTGMTAVLDGAGFLLVGGTRTVSGQNTDFAVCRFNPDGDLAAFPGNPQNLACVSIAFDIGGDNADVLKDIAIQDDGKIILVGDAGFSGTLVEAAVARLDADGTLDAGFGTGGRQYFLGNGFSNHRLNAVVIDPNGKIAVGGSAVVNGTTHTEGLIARLTSTGDLDTGFHGDGLDTYGQGAQNYVVNGIALGRVSGGGNRELFITGAGETGFDSGVFHGWVTYRQGDGQSWFFFGDGGNLHIDGGHDLRYSAIHEMPDGRMLLAGTRTASQGADSDFRATLISRLGVVNALDFNFPFGHISVDVTQNNRQDTAYALAVHPNRIVVVGTSLTATPPANLDFAAVALRVDRIFRNGVEADD